MNTFQFFSNGINKSTLLLRKGVYLCEYIHKWKNFNEISFPKKKDFYSNLSMEDITNSDHNHAK